MKKSMSTRLKRLTSCLVAAVMMVSMLPVQVFAVEEDGAESACTHPNKFIFAPAKEPTCTEGGSTEGFSCSDCGAAQMDEAIPALGHDWVTDAAVPPTCTVNGKTEGKHCDRCGQVDVAQESVPFLGHTTVADPYQAPTCTESGKTAGSHCSVCGTVLIAQTVIEASGHKYTEQTVLPGCETGGYINHVCSTCGDSYMTDESAAKGHSWDSGLETTAPTCDKPGVKTFTCSNCGGTKREDIAPKGHDLVYVDAKQPTYSGIGWEAYERCTRDDCGHTTLVPIPKLERDDIADYASFMENLKLLEDYANDFAKANPGKDPAMLVIKYIRTGVDRYNSGSWNIMAGYEDPDFAKYVEDREDAYNSEMASEEDMIQVASLKNIQNFKLPNGDLTDIGHMFGTMDISYTNINSINHADVGGWAGDLVDLLSLSDQFGVSGTLEEMAAEIGTNYFLKSTFPEEPIEGTFSQTDFYGDLDAFYVMQKLTGQEYTNGLIYNILDAYFTEELTNADRAGFLLEHRLGNTAGRSDIRDAVYEAYTKNNVIATLEGTREFKSQDLSDLRRACCYAFADYLCKLAGDYVEVGENVYYDVFQTEKSVLAPGITQEIKKAYTADDKQIVYYIATADINSQYVDVFANYKDNDPSLGWGMQRVREQANAAQARHSNPDDPELYIPNYTVIAAINGAGYNMSTGEPGGLLIMDGVQYHEPNSNGFFGILKDGTAKIGTTAEYYELYEQGLIKEGISAFGSTLVKDGKVAISGTSNYFSDRASRTAVGITKTGRVVFMVLDGRQEPVSCGGSMDEIAQIMLEAGCVEAVNLDGGGSTTYLAKQPGDDELSLVSSPSDGFERSVSTSLIMVSTAPSSTAFDKAVLSAQHKYLTVGAQTQITAAGVSPMGNAAEIPEGTTWKVSDESVGSIDENGLFTAAKNGEVDVNLMLDGEAVGSITLYVKQPTAIYFTRADMDAVYGQAAAMPLKALYDGKEMAIVDSDVTFSLSNDAAGSFDGFNFTGDEASGIKSVTVTAKLVSDSTITASIKVALFNADEYSFDFEHATGGDRQLAWLREVSNSVTTDDTTYTVDQVGEDMVTSYSFGIDMTQIPIPPQLEDLTYMLPGADVAGNNTAWSFLLQLAERISVMSYVQPVIRFDENLDVDYSDLTIACEYFDLDDENGVVLNEETNELTLTLHWIDQTKAIDPETANPICVVSGIKLTPKDGAPWDDKDRLILDNQGKIGYNIAMRANALYTFSMKPENQAAYGLLPFVNPKDESEKGGSFQSVYKEFTDTYTLVNGLKNGWINEEGGYAYYIEGQRLTGIHKVGDFYYDFGDTGINVGQQKYSGLFEENGVAHYAKFGVLTSGWVTVGEFSYCFDDNCNGYDGTFTIDEVEMVFEKGKLVGGHTGFITKTDGHTYHYQNGAPTYGWYQDGDILYHFNTGTGTMTTGTHVCPDAEAKAKGAYYDFADNGETLRGYFNPSGYYYWAGLPKTDSWVKEGSDPDPDAWYHTNSHGHYVTDPSGNEVFELVLDGEVYDAVKIAYDGVVYTFDNTNGKLLLGDIVVEGGSRYYYWAGQPFTGGWFDFNDKTYYALDNGKLATGNQVIDGENYVFNGNGELVTDGIRVIATVSDDHKELKLQVKGVEEDLEKVIFAIWAAGVPQEETLTWVTVEEKTAGEWSATVPMCQESFYGVTGMYNIHAFGNEIGNLIADTTANITASADHTYTDGTDIDCDLCGHVRELTDLAVTFGLTEDSKQILVKLGGVDEAVTKIRAYAWPNDSNQNAAMYEADAIKGSNDIWSAYIPLCYPAFDGAAGTYSIHVYDITNAPADMLDNGSVHVNDAVEHTYADQTDTTCDLCGHVREIAHVHAWASQWTSNDTHHWHECTAQDCSLTEISAKDGYGQHSYTNAGDATCDCGYVREVALEDELKGMVADKESLTEDEIRDAVQSMDTDELKSAMQADLEGTGVMADIAQLEEAVGGAADIIVTPEAQGFDADKISIVGANLNSASSNEGITLVIDKPEMNRELDANYDSTVAVKFSMELTNVANSENLAVPVMITLPIPAAITPQHLVILHYHAGTAEVVANPRTYQDGSQWYASFVVTGFSDFVMTQRVVVCSHTGGTATCLEQAICGTCGKPYGEKNMSNHTGQAKWTSTADVHSQAYTCCATVVIPEAPHNWVDNICSDCEYVREIPQPTMHAMLSVDGVSMRAELSNAQDMTGVRFAVWVSGHHQDTIKWFDAELKADGIWSAEMALCQFGMEGQYNIHAYAIEDGEEVPVADTSIHAEAVPHIYSDDMDTTCDRCGAERDITIPTTPMHRLYNPNSGEHFYTGSSQERDVLTAAGWIYEGIAWNAPTNSGAPVHRLYNPNSGDHHYTMSAEEKDMLVSVGWIYEGVCWNSAPTDHPDSMSLYRLFNPNADCGSHHYTGSEEEKNMLVSAGWIFEGIGWFGMVK